VMAEEGVERLFVADAYQRHIVPYLQMLQEQRRALVGEEEQVRARELRDELDLREEVARYHEQYIAPYLAMRQRHIAERNELCQQECAARGFGPGQCIRLHAMPWLLRGIAAEEVRERNELMRGHMVYLEQCEREQEERRRVACDALYGQEERARRSLQHEEDRLRSSQFLNFWIIRSLRLQGRYVPRGHDTVTNRFEGTNAREMMERLELLTPAQLDELELRELLDMPVHCSHNDVKAAYRRFCLANHPDKTRELPERERQSRAAKLAKMTDIYKCVDGRAQLRQTSVAEVARKREAELAALRQKHREQLTSHDRYALEELRVIPMTSLLWSMRNAALNRERRDIVASQEREMRRFLAENPGSPA